MASAVDYVDKLEALDAEFQPKVASALDKFYEDNCVQEGPERFLCPLSGKRFKGKEFVRKHIDNKHQDTLAEVRDRVLQEKYFQTFALDPQRPQKAMRIQLRPPRAHAALARVIGGTAAAASVAGHSAWPRPERERPYLGGGTGVGLGGGMLDHDQMGPGSFPMGPSGLGMRDRRDPRPLRQYVDLDVPDEDDLRPAGDRAAPVVYD